MAGQKRPRARIVGADRARETTMAAGRTVALARARRGLSQEALGLRIGISRSRLANIEAGHGTGTPAEVWFALAEALGIYLRFEFGRDSQADVRDAGHLDIQELVLRVAKPASWERAFEAKRGGLGSNRSVDVRLIDRKRRRLVINECWNTFGDLGEATRSSTRKLHDAEQQAVVLGGEGEPFAIGLVWIVRNTKANRALVSRYPELFASRFPGSSAAWLEAITDGGPMPTEAGLIWCDLRATRLFARRRSR